MQSTKQSTGTKIIFWTVIAVMVLGSVVSFSAFSFLTPGQQAPVVQSKSKGIVGESIEGVVKKMELGESQTVYYLETAGTMTTFLTSSSSDIKLDKYVEKNVKVQGIASGANEENSAPMLSVTKIELAN